MRFKIDDYVGDIISSIGMIIYCMGLYFLSDNIALPITIAGIELFLIGICIDQNKG